MREHRPVPTGARPHMLIPQIAAQNLRVWQESVALDLATDAQRKIMLQSPEMREAELRHLARGELFSPLIEFRVRHRKRDHVVRHSTACGYHSVERNMRPRATWSTDALHTEMMTSDELRAFSDIARIAHGIESHEWLRATHDAVTAAARTHTAMCPQCGGDFTESCVLVSIRWAERILSREYHLQGERK